MANVMGTLSQSLVTQRAKTLTHLITLRLVTGYTLLIVTLVSLLGGDWDIQWHATIGRDRTFTPPHDMILAGIALAGIVALISILLETRWTAQHHLLAQENTDFLGGIHSSLGSYFVGFGAVCSAVAFPLDTYWHSLYGIDVSLWAPFHTMIYMGGVLSNIGIIYILLSAAHLAQSEQQKSKAYAGYIGVIVASGILLSRLCTFLVPALQGHAINFGFGATSLFPLLLSACVAFVCVFVVNVIRWPGTATLTIIAFLAAYLLVSAFVPPMMKLLMQTEHQTYLARAASIGSHVVPLLSQSPLLLLVGLSIDSIVLIGRRMCWSLTALNRGTAFTAAISAMVASALMLIIIGTALLRGHANSGHVSLALLLSLILALAGGLLGSWLAQILSQTVQELRR